MTEIGTKENPLRILVADNWGADAHGTLKRKFPNVSFSTYVETSSTHPHGHMVAECICHMLPSDKFVEIVFLPYLELQNAPEYNWKNVIESERKAGRPFHIANCSFGAHHGNDDIWKFLLGAKWNTPEKLAEAKEKIGDTIVLFASGNQDSSTDKKDHMENDVNYPQKALSQLENVFVIGACDYRSIPSLFSSDGEQVFAMYLGENVVLFDPTINRIVSVNGTSFASPFAAGNVAEYILKGEKITHEWYLNLVLTKGWTARGWIRGKQHRKAGYGSMISEMYNKKYFKTYYRPRNGKLSALSRIETCYHDFKKIN